MTTLYPFIALGSLVNAVFSMHSSVLFVLRRNSQVAVFHFAYVALLAGGALVLVPLIGLIGYGLAELMTMAAYVVIHRQVATLFTLRYRASAPWLFALAPPIFAPLLPLPFAPLLFLPAVALLFLRR